MSGPPPAQRRMTNIPNSTGRGNLPYVLHTTDEYPYPCATVPSHAIALRTVDITTPTYSGGGKLGIYAYWTPGTTAIKSLSLTGISAAQFEFYDYTSAANYGETGNSAIANGALTSEAQAYLSFFESLAPSGGSNGKELYDFSPLPVQQNRQAALSLYFAYVNAKCGS